MSGATCEMSYEPTALLDWELKAAPSSQGMPGNRTRAPSCAKAIVACHHFWSSQSWRLPKPCQSKPESCLAVQKGQPGGSSCLRHTGLAAASVGCVTAELQSEQSELTNSWSSPTLLLEDSLVTIRDWVLMLAPGPLESPIFAPPINGDPRCRTDVLFSSHAKLGFFGECGFLHHSAQVTEIRQSWNLRKPQL